MNNSAIKDIISGLDLSIGINHTIDVCPSCGKSRKFTVTLLEDGTIAYNCFSASCSLKGYIKDPLRLLEINNSRKRVCNARTAPEQAFRLPTYIEAGFGTEEGLQMLIDYNAYDSYRAGLYTTYYDVKENRLCFPVYALDGSLQGLIGRRIPPYNRNSVLKTKVYGNSRYPFIVGCSAGNASKQKHILVLVEDCLSACSWARVPNVMAMSLNGTNISKDQRAFIDDISGSLAHIVIALDRDALMKARDIQKLLHIYKTGGKLPIHIAHLHNDAKDIKDASVLYDSLLFIH